MAQTLNQHCTLCETLIYREGYRDENRPFCCAGCQAVYQILAAQSSLDNFQNHPVFRQALQSGLISNPDLIAKECLAPDGEFKKLHLEIHEMWCPSCAKVISLILTQEKGVRSAIVDYATDLAAIEFTPRYISEEKIIDLIKKLGYKPASLQDPRQSAFSHSLYLRFIIAAFLALNVMMFAYPIYASYFEDHPDGYSHLFGWLSLVGSLPVLSYCAWPIWRRFYSAIQVGVWGMELLVLMGVSAATILSLYELLNGGLYVYFDSMTVIIVFVLLGKIIESKAKFSAKDALIELTRALPRRGRKKNANGTTQFVPLKEIHPGDYLVVMTGEKIVLDGAVSEGNGLCDESLMTGESLPIQKEIGSTVLAGTILQQGFLVIKVTATMEETALHRIIEMVEQDIGHKSEYVRAADQIVKWFVPIVIALAFSTFFYCLIFHTVQIALIRAISVLLISCPCAIGIAAPLVESSVLNAMAKLGALVRNRGCLPFLGRETIFISDKTGTLTEGKFTLLSGLEALSSEDKQALKGLVQRSIHPLALALNRDLIETATSFDFIEEVVGKGIRGIKQETHYCLGSASFLQMTPPQQILDGIYTTLYFAKNNHCLATIVLGDQLRSDAPALIKAFSKTLLVSGDASTSVEAVAKACQFSGWYAGYHPLQKRQLVDQLKKDGEIVVMLGDGVNDAPALTAAHVGIAVVSATDISIQVSDLLLTTPKLDTIPKLRAIAIRGRKIIKQNLFWAFFYNCVGIALAMAGYLTPLFAAFAMVISSLIVLLNARRTH